MSVRGNQKKPSMVHQTTASPLGLKGRPGAHRLDGGFVAWKEAWPDAAVVVHVGHHALDMMLDGLDGGLGGAEPELLVRVEAKPLGDLEDAVEWQVARQTLLVPAGDGPIPPHGPFPAGEPIHGLEVHDRTEPLGVVHGGDSLRRLRSCAIRPIRTAPPLSSARHRADLHFDSTRVLERNAREIGHVTDVRPE